jgi:hypothetical protein
MTSSLPTALDEPWHGTANGYTHKKCRCIDCKAAKAEERKKAKSRPIMGDEEWHGTITGYNYHWCRCFSCKKSMSDYNQKRRQLKLNQAITGNELWHGTVTGYTNQHCRCNACKKAEKISSAARRHHLPINLVKEILTDPVCSTCGKTQLKEKQFHFDHDHNCCPGKYSCGKCFRGLLCQKCNLVLGHVYDNPIILRNLANYLERYSLDQ